MSRRYTKPQSIGLSNALFQRFLHQGGKTIVNAALGFIQASTYGTFVAHENCWIAVKLRIWDKVTEWWAVPTLQVFSIGNSHPRLDGML